MVFFNVLHSSSPQPLASSSSSPGSNLPPDHPPVPTSSTADQCPVDHSTRSKWLSTTTTTSSSNDEHSHPLRAVGPSSITLTSGTGSREIPLSTERVISSIPRAKGFYPSSEGVTPYSPDSPSSPFSSSSSSSSSVAAASAASSSSLSPSRAVTSPSKPRHNAKSDINEGKVEDGHGNWVYPSETQFFQALLRKNHNPQKKDMRTVVPIHNAVNEKTWEEILSWEAKVGGGLECGGIRLISFSGRPNERSPKAWIKSLAGYTPPFDRHDWLIDRCGKQVRYVIDYYAGKSDPNQPNKLSFYLDVRPAVDDWEGIRTRLAGLWK